MSERDCIHGQLARSCGLCERDATIAALQTRVETELRNVSTLENKVYLNGHWRCAKCDFYQVSTNLYVPSGNMSANDTPQECANGCGPMWRVTHEQSCNTVVDRLEKMQEERNVLRAEAERYKLALRQIATGAEDDHDGFAYAEIAQIAFIALKPPSGETSAPFKPNKPCKNPDECRKAAFCMDGWLCAAASAQEQKL